MKKSCLIIVSCWTAFFIGYFFLLKPYLPWPSRSIFAGMAALAVLALYSSLRNVVTTRQKSRAIRRAERGVPPEDGKFSAAIGRIQPNVAPLKAPLSGGDCVAYDYKIYREDSQAKSNRDRDENIYGGVAMCPCSIQTSLGRYRLLGFPMLEHVPQQFYPPIRAREMFAQHSRRVFFEDASSAQGIWEQISRAEELLLDNDGAIQRDMRLGKEPEDWSGLKFREQSVESGAEVVVFGKFSAMRQGFLNEEDLSAANDLYLGKPAQVMKEIRGSMVYLLLFSIAYFSFFHGLIALFLWGPK